MQAFLLFILHESISVKSSILLSYQALIILSIASKKFNRSYGYAEIFCLALNKIIFDLYDIIHLT
jgi:hypothetical protein